MERIPVEIQWVCRAQPLWARKLGDSHHRGRSWSLALLLWQRCRHDQPRL